MHELSIAYSVVEIATESAVAAGAVRVKEVHVRLGALSGVVRGALEFSYEMACAGTMLEGSRLVVRGVAGARFIARCASAKWSCRVRSIFAARCAIRRAAICGRGGSWM